MALPVYQPQNPAFNGFYLGWSSCTSYAYAMAVSYDQQVPRYVTGETVRRNTRDTVGGTTLLQNNASIVRLFGEDFDLDVRTPVHWDTLVEKHEKGHGVVLQGHGEVFTGTRFFANAAVNHALFLPGDKAWAAMDPAADGRRSGIYRWRNESYGEALIKKFAARLILDLSRPDRRLGSGWAYAAFTRDRTASHEAVIRPRPGSAYRYFTTYEIRNLPDNIRLVTGTPVRRRTKGFAIPCTPPKVVTGPNGTVASMVKLLHPGHPQDGWWVSSAWEREV